MKILSIATLALLQVSAIQLRYDVSEGPTKADNGENDHQVIAADTKWLKDNWTNPLDWKDNGDGDETVLTMLDGSLRRPRRIYDADGDGVEDNVEKTREELDRFYIPQVFGPAEELHNTHHGNLPGHVRLEEETYAPEDPMDKLYNFSELTLNI